MDLEMAVPEDQRPVNELAALKQAWLYSWVRVRTRGTLQFTDCYSCTMLSQRCWQQCTVQTPQQQMIQGNQLAQPDARMLGMALWQQLISSFCCSHYCLHLCRRCCHWVTMSSGLRWSLVSSSHLLVSNWQGVCCWQLPGQHSRPTTQCKRDTTAKVVTYGSSHMMLTAFLFLMCRGAHC